MIVDAARRLIAERGEQFTTQELVKEAGVALQTFYRLFAGKDQLLLAVFEDLIAENCAQYEEAARELPDPVDAVALLHHRGAADSRHDGRRRHRAPLRHRGALASLPALSRRDGTRRRSRSPTSWRAQLELAAAEGLLAPADVERDAWFVTKLVMAVFHHYTFADDRQRRGGGARTTLDVLLCRSAAESPRLRPAPAARPDATRTSRNRQWGESKCAPHDDEFAPVSVWRSPRCWRPSASRRPSGAAVPAADEGVTAKAIKLGFVYPATGVAASISKNGLEAFQARIDRQNAAGGVNGRKIEVVARSTTRPRGRTSPATQDLVENEHVFAVVHESPFAFLSYRWLLDHDVPDDRQRPRRHVLPAEGQRGHPVVLGEQQSLR